MKGKQNASKKRKEPDEPDQPDEPRDESLDESPQRADANEPPAVESAGARRPRCRRTLSLFACGSTATVVVRRSPSLFPAESG